VNDAQAGAVEATGERYVPELMAGGVLEAEHRARYQLVASRVAGRTVLDAGCGVGWGSELLLAAGARRVTGVDLSPDAIANARARVPGARFLVGDLVALGLETAEFDVVVCFEALEHVPDPLQCLDELVRVLHPDGTLFVSSPNPDVYPAGNPFHVRELPPEELATEVGKRLPHVQLLRQHLLVTSLLLPDDPSAAAGDAALDAVVHTIAPLEPGHDPYSMVVAARTPLDEVDALAMVAPSHQLDHLDDLTRAVLEQRAAQEADHERIVAERTALLTEVDEHRSTIAGLHTRLTDADAGLHRLTDDIDRANRELAVRRQQLEEMTTARLDLEQRLEEAQLRLDRVTADRERSAADRERYAAALVQSEQALARARLEADAAIAQARVDHAALQAEHDATRATLSWRVTTPLRTVRRRFRSR
jgi:SAM-dependent methyltransferase